MNDALTLREASEKADIDAWVAIGGASEGELEDAPLLDALGVHGLAAKEADERYAVKEAILRTLRMVLKITRLWPMHPTPYSV